MKEFSADISWVWREWRYRLIWNTRNGTGLQLSRYNRKKNETQLVWPRSRTED